MCAKCSASHRADLGRNLPRLPKRQWRRAAACCRACSRRLPGGLPSPSAIRQLGYRRSVANRRRLATSHSAIARDRLLRGASGGGVAPSSVRTAVIPYFTSKSGDNSGAASVSAKVVIGMPVVALPTCDRRFRPPFGCGPCRSGPRRIDGKAASCPLPAASACATFTSLAGSPANQVTGWPAAAKSSISRPTVSRSASFERRHAPRRRANRSKRIEPRQEVEHASQNVSQDRSEVEPVVRAIPFGTA